MLNIVALVLRTKKSQIHPFNAQIFNARNPRPLIVQDETCMYLKTEEIRLCTQFVPLSNMNQSNTQTEISGEAF